LAHQKPGELPLAAVGLGACLIISVFFLPLGEEGLAVDTAC
jgi:hypothetical protein